MSDTFNSEQADAASTSIQQPVDIQDPGFEIDLEEDSAAFPTNTANSDNAPIEPNTAGLQDDAMDIEVEDAVKPEPIV